MPYKVFKVDNQYCVYKLDGDGNRTGDTLGCHDAKTEAQDQVAALYAAESKDFGDLPIIYKTATGVYATATLDGVPVWRRVDKALVDGLPMPQSATVSDLRLMLLVTSNAYRDRESEIIRQQAWEHYVEKAWDGDAFANSTPLLFWHAGEPIGEIIYADMEGPFLIEVARELADKQLDIMTGDEKLSIISRMHRTAVARAIVDDPRHTTVKEVWDSIERTAEKMDWATSPEFLYLKPDRADKMYERVLKQETSVLPRDHAANEFTLAEVRQQRST